LSDKVIVWFSELNKNDIAIAGGKGANLGEMYNARLPVPPGFIVTAQAYKHFLNQTGIQNKILSIVSSLDLEDTEKLQKAAQDIQEIILDAEMPQLIKNAIIESYDDLNVDRAVTKAIGRDVLNTFIKAGRQAPFVAVRSSATAEDLPEASFAGQQETFLNVRGKDDVILSVQKCWASLFTARAIYYRAKNNFPTDKVLIAVVIQKMVNSDKSGVMFSINPATNNQSEIMIESAFGLGEVVVGGQITPDTYIVDKNSLEIKSKKITKQEYGIFRDQYTGRNIKKNLSEQEGTRQKLSEQEIIDLAKYGKVLEDHYQKPMDTEWAIENNKLYIVQTRPVTTLLTNKHNHVDQISSNLKEILKGLGASPGAATGKVKIVLDMNQLGKFQKGDVLVTRMTTPDFVPAMRKAVAIVTDEGGITSHASIVSRELGIPCVVGTEKATQILQDDEEISVDGSNGVVYSGKVSINMEQSPAQESNIQSTEVNQAQTEITNQEHVGDIITGTKILMNLGEPDKIDDYKHLPFEGIGLMRIEFIITDSIGKHPLYMIQTGQQQEYINKLSEGIRKVASTINPKPLIVRFSDFKTNEYKNLQGGEQFEPKEENPLIGWRGVSRYISEEFKEAFRLEIKAIKIVRESGLKNVHVMLPFVRNTDEVRKCLKILNDEGLYNNHEFRIYLMAAVPSMALIPEEFAELPIYGASIGSNDLTMGVLGIDRDSARLGKMGYFDERNPAVLKAISNIIRGFKKHNKTVSICGQAPSEYEEIVEFLVKEGIDSISVSPDVVSKTRRVVASIERNILLGKIRGY
jgi:pyruvate,water dikinase